MLQALQLNLKQKYLWQLNQIDLTENKNKKIGVYCSVGIHAFMAIVFFILLAWTAPDPPIPEYGIEFSMALGAESASESQIEPEEAKNEVVEVEAESTEVLEQSDVSKENIDESLPIDAEQQVVEDSESVETEDINSPDVIDPIVEKESQAGPEEVEQVHVVEESTATMATEVLNQESQKEEVVEEKVEEAPEIEERAIMKGGDSEGKSDAESEGSSLSLSGWDWDFKPQPNDTSTENGKIVFQITVDEEGEILKIVTLEKTVSPVVEKMYKDAVMDLTFSKTSNNRTAAISSVGKITFLIRSK